MLLSSVFRKLADTKSNPHSLSNRLRAKRFEKFEDLASRLPRPIRILDVGGENSFWEKRGWAGIDDVQITLLNIIEQQKRNANVTPMIGYATDLSRFADRSFDIVFSNSVIEHLFTFENQARMAAEVRRVGKALWVQTPNFWFPIEPHFLIPGWQWMPSSARVGLLRRYRCGCYPPCYDRNRANQIVTEVRLMTARELRSLFPTATLIPERFAGIVKSWTVVDGFPARNPLGLSSRNDGDARRVA
jgi:Methyltransferase domain